MGTIKWQEQNIKDGNAFLYVGEKMPFNAIVAGSSKIDGRSFYEYLVCPAAMITPAKIDSCGSVGESFFQLFFKEELEMRPVECALQKGRIRIFSNHSFLSCR